ncbi:MAG: DNA mismatch repair protein MutS [Candidatus Thermoplasmatota archaeon]|jgi:DNA mismatch repair ATPase MutS|nr:DNA mismatch repair protein MutS [Candidatus Thermoplasmatota archaeon]
MRVNLLFRNGNHSTPEGIPWNSEDLEKDLDLETIYNAMADRDSYLFDVCRKTVLNSLKDRETIMYRQDATRDAIENQALVRDIYTTIVNAVAEARKQHFWISRSNPEFVLHESISVLKIYLSALTKIREIGRSALPSLHSEGFRQLFTMIIQEFSEEYIDMVSKHLENLRFPMGIYVRGGIGIGNSLTGYTLVVPDVRPGKLMERITHIREPHYTYVLPDRDESGAQALAEMRTRSIRETSEIVSESAKNVLAFMDRLKEEVAFYLGCINLWNKLKFLGAKTSFPVPENDHKKGTIYENIYDVALSLRTDQTVVGNSLNAENDNIIFITGANKGGKSTLLRAIGQAQLMMQCGIFVAAESFSTYIASGLFTHFKREEDSGMIMGKFDEELSRMSTIIDHISAGSRLLFNESFSSTNVREGSELAMQIINALLDRGIKIVFVTHFNELAEAYIGDVHRPTFLRAERLEDGTRTFRVIRADPIPTSFGYDIFQKVFGESAEIEAVTAPGNTGDETTS